MRAAVIAACGLALLSGAHAQVVAPVAQPWVLPGGSIDFLALPSWTQCDQEVKPPGVKPGACMQVMCMPKSIQPGNKFHITIRFCLQRPRRWHLAFGLLDIHSKAYYGGEGNGIVDTVSQCGEVTFEHVFDAKPSPGLGIFDLMWKFYIIPNHGMNGYYVEDTFPNMLAEAGVDKQPNYLAPLDPALDCPNNPMKQWDLPPTGFQNGIDYNIIPKCFTPGQPWIVQVDTHLETAAEADLHCNLQIGSGGDVYLGPEDVYVTESNIYMVQANPKTASWDNVPAGYWTTHPILFSAAQTALVQPNTNVYLACFMVPVGAVYNAATPGGWNILEREFYLKMQFCDANAIVDANADGIDDVPTDYDLNGDGTVDGQAPQPNPNFIDLNGDGVAAEEDHNADGIADADTNGDGIVDDLNGDGAADIAPSIVYGPEALTALPPPPQAGALPPPPQAGAVPPPTQAGPVVPPVGPAVASNADDGDAGPDAGPVQGAANADGVVIDEFGNVFVDANADGVDDRRDGVFTDVNNDGIDDSDQAAQAARAGAAQDANVIAAGANKGDRRRLARYI